MSGIAFQNEWLNDPNLKDWIVPVSNSDKHVYCRFCEQIYRAHKCDLTTHLNTEKHKRNVRDKKERGLYNLSPLDVKIAVQVNNDGRDLVAVNNTDDDDEFEEEDSSLSAAECDLIALQLPPKCPTKKKNSYSYSKRWESDPILKDWIRPVIDDITKAHCGPCDLTMCAKLFTLTNHSKTSRHKTIMDALVAATTNNNTTYRNQEFRDNEENLGAIYSSQAIIGNGEALFDDNDEYQIKEERMDIEMKDMSSITPSTNRPKIETSMFLEAITNGEFENKELLKIARCALDKMANN